MADEVVVSGEEDLCHYVAVIAKVLEGILRAQVIKAVGLWLPVMADMAIGTIAVLLNDGVAFLNEFKADLPAA